MGDNVGRDTPSIVLGEQEDYRRLFYSEPKAALVVPIAIMSGYGICYMGQTLAKNGSAAGSKNKMIPYDPSTIDGTQEHHPRMYLVQDGAANTSVYVTLEDSYRCAVGDDLYAVDSDATPVDLGAITAIDRTTYSHMAVITVTNNVTTAITTAKFGYAYIEGADACVGILQKSVDTGEGKDAKGAVAALILGNCVLYTGRLTNLDAAAITDISAVAFGNFTYIK